MVGLHRIFISRVPKQSLSVSPGRPSIFSSLNLIPYLWSSFEAAYTCSLVNPLFKRFLVESFADSKDIVMLKHPPFAKRFTILSLIKSGRICAWKGTPIYLEYFSIKEEKSECRLKISS